MNYQWKVAANSGGPFSNITTGTGANTPTYTSAPLITGTYYVMFETTCTTASLTSTSNIVTLTVEGSPSVTASSTDTFICSGQSVSLTSSAVGGTVFQWSGPNNFSSTSQNTVVSNAPVIASGIYTLTASANNCTSTPAFINVTVNAVPGQLTVNPSPALICGGDTITLYAQGGDIPDAVFNFTPQTNQNTSSTYPACYSAYYGGQKMQFLILASELTAAGMVAGPLTSIQFPVVSKNSNWGNTITECQNFQVSLGHTTLTSVGASFQSGLTVVYGPVSFTPNVGYSNVHNFSPSFTWDGVSNLIVETVFSNNFAAGTNDAVIQYNSPTSFQSTMVYRADNQTFATIAAATTTNVTTALKRPDFILKSHISGTYSWTPSLGLLSISDPSVKASPASNTIYTVTMTNAICSSSATGSVNVNITPTLSISSTATSVCAGETLTLTATGAPNYTWSTNSTNSVEVVTPTQSAVFTVSNEIVPCPVATADFSVIVNPLPAILAAASSTGICLGETATLTATGANTYTWNTNSNDSIYAITPVMNGTYTVNGTDLYGCSSSQTVALDVNPLPVLNIVQTNTFVCVPGTVGFTVSGASTYSWSTGVTTSTMSLSPAANATVMVTGVDNFGCATTGTANVIASASPTLQISSFSPTACAGSPVTFTAQGANTYTWNNGSNSSITTVTVLASGNYTASGTNSAGCTSSQSVSVTSIPLPSIAFSARADTICENETITYTATGADSYTWMPDNIIGAIATYTPGSSATFTVTGSALNGCKNSVTATVFLSPCNKIDENSSLNSLVSVYPNPTNGSVHLNFGIEGPKQIVILNSIGERLTDKLSYSNIESLDLSSYAKGIYIVKISIGSEAINYRIVLQ